MARLLDGVVVLDFSRVLAGPFAAMLLAQLGARVIKIEPPGGDEARGFGPFAGEHSLYFIGVNQGKAGLALDLKQPQGLDLARRLTERADVLLENFRPGTLDRLGLGYATLSDRNPRLVYCSLSGFGQFGPRSAHGAYDVIIQAASGLMGLTGPEGGPPVRVGASVGDLIPALYAVIGIVSALYRRAQSGQGCYLDLAMQDAAVTVVENALARAWATGEDPQPLGSRHPAITPFASFPTSDGEIVVAAGNEALWERLCAAIERPDLLDHPDYATNALRTTHVQALTDTLSGTFRQRTTAAWLAVLEAAGIPASRVARISDLLQDEHLLARRMIQELEQPGVGRLPVPGNPIKASGYDDSLRGPAPAYGADAETVLHELLGLTAEEVATLRRSGALLGDESQGTSPSQG